MNLTLSLENWQSLKNGDLADEKVYRAIRRDVLRPLLGEKSTEAVPILQRLIQSEPSRTRERCELASMYLRNGQTDNAVEEIIRAHKLAPDNADIAAQALQILLGANKNSDAAELAIQLKRLWPTNGRLADMATRALARGGMAEQALEAAVHSIALNKENTAVLAKAAAVLNSFGRASEASKAFDKLGERIVADEAALFELGRSGYLLDKRSPAALTLLQHAHVLAPTNKRYADLLSRALLSNGRAAEAVEIIEKTKCMDTGTAARLHYARGLKSVQKHEQAAVEISKVLALDPDNLATQRYAAGMLMMAGRENEARDIQLQSRNARRIKLPETFAKGLELIEQRLDQAAIPQGRFEWAWQQLINTGAVPPSRKTWEATIRRNNLTDYFIIDWLECHPQKRNEVVDFIDGLEDASLALNAELSKGKGVILAGAHIGALFAAPAAMSGASIKASWVASTPNFDGPGKFDDEFGEIISTTTTSTAGLGKRIISALKQGRVVSIAIDGAGGNNYPQFQLFDRKICLSDFAPRLAFKYGTTCFFSNLEWHDGRIKVRLERLPQSLKNEEEGPFIARWVKAYLNHVEAVFRTNPENLRLSGGFWSSISA